MRLWKIFIVIAVTTTVIFSCGKDEPQPAVCTELTWYIDADGDGLGNPNFEQKSCTQPEGYVSDNSDLDDSPTANGTVPDVSNDGYDFTSTDTNGWSLVWEDDFSTSLSNWNIWRGGAFNNELQFYQADNILLGNDYLYIKQKKENVNGPTTAFDNTNKNFGFTSGRIESKTLYSPSRSGGTLKLAARMKLPEGDGLWPAFWSYGDPWPTQGEIDIIEYRGGEPNEYSTNFFYGTTANQPLTNSAVQAKSYTHTESLANEFHVYELEWTLNDLVMKFDGQVLRTYNTDEFQYVDDLYNTMQKITLNLAVGGDFFSNLDESNIPNESYLVVDWVKVYNK